MFEMTNAQRRCLALEEIPPELDASCAAAQQI